MTVEIVVYYMWTWWWWGPCGVMMVGWLEWEASRWRAVWMFWPRRYMWIYQLLYSKYNDKKSYD